jgi:hypothetical protein
MFLSHGLQDGQLKKLSLSFKGLDQSSVTVTCPTLMSYYTQIVFSEVGDQILLMWNGGSWVVLETLNVCDPTIQSPLVQ